MARQDRNPTRPRRLWRVLRGHRPDAGETPRHRGRGLEDGEQGARIRSAEARRFLRSVHGRGPRQPAGEGSARSGARANRRAREQDRPGAPHGAHADAEHDDARRRRSGRGRTGSQDVRSLSVAERPRPPRSRLLPQSRPEAEGVPDEVPGVRREDAHARRTAVTRRRREGDRRLRDTPGARALDECREPRCGQDLQQGDLGGAAQALPRLRLGCVGPGARPGRRQSRRRRRSRVTSRRWPRRSRNCRSIAGSRI